MSREQEILDALYEHVLDGEAPPTVELTKEGLELGMDPLTLLFDAMIPALEEVGRLFEIGEYFVPEMLISARAMAGPPRLIPPIGAVPFRAGSSRNWRRRASGCRPKQQRARRRAPRRACACCQD